MQSPKSVFIKNRVPLKCTAILTHRCNFNCKYCFEQNERGLSDLMSIERWRAFLVELKCAGGLFLTITGGEPLLSDKFKDFYDAAFRLNFLIGLQTNASLLTEEHLCMLSKQPPHKIVVTLYGMSEGSYQAFCGRACFENVKENIRRMASAGLNITVRVVLTRFNYSELGKMREFVNSLGCCFSLFRTLIPETRFGFSQMRHQISPEQYIDSFLDSDELSEHLATRRDLKGNAYCPAGINSFFVDETGMMRLCQKEPCLGIPIEDGYFLENWDALSRLRYELLSPDPCGACSFAEFCRQCPPVSRRLQTSECQEFAVKVDGLLRRAENVIR